MKLWFKREGTNIVVTGKYISKTKNNYGRWEKFVKYLPQGEVETLNASKEEFEFGSSSDFLLGLRTFKDLGASEDIFQALKAQVISHPSHIQALAYKCVLFGKSCIIIEQSGSRKTIAYLTSLLQHLRK